MCHDNVGLISMRLVNKEWDITTLVSLIFHFSVTYSTLCMVVGGGVRISRLVATDPRISKILAIRVDESRDIWSTKNRDDPDINFSAGWRGDTRFPFTCFPSPHSRSSFEATTLLLRCCVVASITVPLSASVLKTLTSRESS
jgi:hypothetical protein